MPAEGGLIHDAGVQRDHVDGGGFQPADIVDTDLLHPGDRVGAGAQFGGEGDDIPGFQRVDLAEIVAYPTVVVE